MLIILWMGLGIPGLHAENNPSPIIFIYDASGSMWGQIQGKTKKEIGADVLTEAIDNLPDNQQIGFIAYGHRNKNDCRDVEFLVDFEKGTKSLVSQSLLKINPLGMTPLAYSAQLVISKLRDTKTKATIILITDGIESCDGNICEVVQSAKKEGIDFRLHIVGLGLKEEETDQLKCAAEAGEGKYFNAGDAAALFTGLEEATITTVDKPIANFSVYASKNGKPVDALIQAYLEGTKGKIEAVRTYGDTSFFYLPPNKYHFEARALENTDMEPVYVYNLESFDEKSIHQTISFDGGKIQMLTLNNGEGWDATVKVLSKDKKTVSASRTYGRVINFEVNPGIYDIEIMALGIEGAENFALVPDVSVKVGQTNSLEHSFHSGIALIGARSAEGLVDATVYIKEVNSNKNVAGKRTYTSASSNPIKFILNPGTYEVTLTALGKYAGKKEIFQMEINTGGTYENTANF